MGRAEVTLGEETNYRNNNNNTRKRIIINITILMRKMIIIGKQKTEINQAKTAKGTMDHKNTQNTDTHKNTHRIQTHTHTKTGHRNRAKTKHMQMERLQWGPDGSSKHGEIELKGQGGARSGRVVSGGGGGRVSTAYGQQNTRLV